MIRKNLHFFTYLPPYKDKYFIVCIELCNKNNMSDIIELHYLKEKEIEIMYNIYNKAIRTAS